jgi:peptide/nickel transport system ATP-binding protein
LNKILRLDSVRKYFPVRRSIKEMFHNNNQSYVRAVDGVSLTIEEGKAFVLAGESGSGKTTLARIVLRAIEPDSGSVIFDGHDITKYEGNKLKKFRTNVQMIHQDPYNSLDPRMRIMDIVMEPLNIHKKSKSRKEKIEDVLEALEKVRLEPTTDIADKFPHMLSGGQRQRASIARSLVLKPKLILADEPVSMLDVSVRAEILELMRNLKDTLKLSYLYITHDLATARFIGDDVGIMYAGKIVEVGPIEQVLLNPLHPYTQALLDAISEPKVHNLEKEKIIRIKQGETRERPKTGCRFFHRCLYSMDICKSDPLLAGEEDNHYVSCFIYPMSL